MLLRRACDGERRSCDCGAGDDAKPALSAEALPSPSTQTLNATDDEMEARLAWNLATTLGDWRDECGAGEASLSVATEGSGGGGGRGGGGTAWDFVATSLSNHTDMEPATSMKAQSDGSPCLHTAGEGTRGSDETQTSEWTTNHANKQHTR
jgi:hypothetical protein